MSDANSLRTMRCPNCGAPLDFQPGQPTTRCKFCDSVIEHSTEAMTDADHAHVISGGPTVQSTPSAGQGRRYVVKMRNGQPVVIETDSAFGTSIQMGGPANTWQTNLGPGSMNSIPMTPVRTPQRSSPLGCLITVVVIVAIALAIPAIIFASSPQAAALMQQVLSGNVQQALGTAGTIGSRIVINRSGVIVPGANDGPPEAIMLTTQYPASGGTSETRLVDVSTATRKLIWQTTPLDAKLYDTPILSNADFVFILNNQQLMALKRTDGTLGWQATLADKVQLNLCDCFKLVGTRLAILSDDGTLEVFDTATGRSQWKASSMSDSPRGLYVLGKQVAFMDRNPKVQGVLRVFDLPTGKETQVMPECKGSEPSPSYADWTTPLYLSPKGTEFYLIFGSFATCAQRWDAQTLKMTWSVPLPTDAPSSLDSPNPVFSADTLYLAHDSAVLAFALANGDSHLAVTDPNYTFNVLTTHGADVIVAAKSQRGTTKYVIWAVNAASGQTHWTFDMGENPPMDFGGIIDDVQPMWVAHAASDGLRVVRFKSAADNKSYSILTDTLNWDTGESAGQKSTPLNLDTIILSAPEWIVWNNDTLWMVEDYQLLAFDVVQHKMVYQWP